MIRGHRGVMDLNKNVSRMLPGGASRARRQRVQGLFVREDNPGTAPGKPPRPRHARRRRGSKPRCAAAQDPTGLAAMPGRPGSCRGAAPGCRQSRAGRSWLGKSFKRRPVLRDVNLSVQRGEVVGLLGPNGAGKTTCFYIITGLIAADTGTVELDGQDITDLPMYRRARLGIGYLPQEASIFRGLTVEQNIRAVLEVAEPEPEIREAMLDALLAEFSISHCAARRRWRFRAASGGAAKSPGRWRPEPHFILLDEPLAGIDPIAVGEIRNLVAHLKDRGIGVLITDHNVRER